MRTVIKIGVVFEIPLSDGRKAYGQYVYYNMGPIIRIFNYFTTQEEKPDLSKMDASNLLFPPIYGNVHMAMRLKMWKIIGKLPVDIYKFKGFLSHNPVLPMPKDKKEPVRIQSWFFWNGEKKIPLGERLPEEYQDYESRAIHSPDLIAKRIETGFDMFENPKKFNRFLTKEEVERKLQSN